jgi:hypothetical protein
MSTDHLLFTLLEPFRRRRCITSRPPRLEGTQAPRRAEDWQVLAQDEIDARDRERKPTGCSRQALVGPMCLGQ